MTKLIHCLIVDDELIAREVIATHLKKIDTIKVIGECGNAFEALNIINSKTIDLLFLDINMPELSGISFAKAIPKDIKVIFTTAYRDYAVEGFELRAVDYLLKPISFERLYQAVTHYFEIHHTENTLTESLKDKDSFLFVRSDRQMVKVDFENIIYIESYSDYIKIHTATGTIVTRENISTIENKLPSSCFLRIHRSYIVALKHITSFTKEQVIIANISLTISRSYKGEVLRRLEGV